MKEQFFQNYGTPLNAGIEYENFVETNLVEEKYINKTHGYLKLIFDENDLLAEVVSYSSGERDDPSELKRLNIEQAIGKLKYLDFPSNTPLTLILDSNGVSYLGGKSESFVIPESPELSKFQHFGIISKHDPAFNELDFDINLTFPLFCDAGELILDYSDQNKPKIYNHREFWTDEVYDDLGPNFIIEYSKVPISFVPLKGKIIEEEELGRAGIFLSDFAYGFNRPLSPITNKPMSFLCQIEGGKEFPVSYTSLPKDRYNYGFDYLEFYSGNGEITIFYENESRLVYYICGGS